ncbi:MAG: HAMP domain-containing sensor histidine kinase [Mycoplasmatota bacterium]|nr:HAMP domain-containing sensor histidine kinase [Mycoplasmatota bacterium]
MKKNNSLNREIWKYFLIFSIVILGVLWIFQVLFLDQYYRYVKINDIKSVAKLIALRQSSSKFSDIVDKAAYDSEVCVEVINSNFVTLYSSSSYGRGCFTGKETSMNYKYNFMTSGEKNKTYELINPMYNNDTLVYAVKLKNNKYAFVNTSLDPVDSTVDIIQEQLVIVLVVVLILSFAISYFMSNYISLPIVKMNTAAKQLAKRDFNVKFENDSNILEINELAETLNYASSELSKTDELRRDLMANVSHDLKTPLTMIKAYAEMSTDLHANNKAKQKEDMNIIANEVDRLTILVNDILTLSKMQSNIESLDIEEFDLISLIDDILERYKVLKETESYTFNFNHKKKKIMIKADRKKLEQVIYNLVNNAINYTGEDNSVTINITGENDYVVEIIDTGKGIKEEDLPYIWDKYYKNNKKHKRNLVGTGLGLSIVKNILELHGFEHGVKSSVGKGTNFYFIISNKEKSLDD